MWFVNWQKLTDRFYGQNKTDIKTKKQTERQSNLIII